MANRLSGHISILHINSHSHSFANKILHTYVCYILINLLWQDSQISSHTCTHTCTQAHVHTRTHTYTRAHTHTHAHTHKDVCIS